MIHLVTDAAALNDCLQWRDTDEPVMLWGDSVTHAPRVQKAIGCLCWVMASDAKALRLVDVTALSPEQWVQHLLETPCRTWS